MSLKKPVGRYITIRKLPKSGLATSYLAYDPLFERKVVAKVFADHATNDREFCSRLRQQSEIALTLTHPCFVQLYDVVKDEEELHIVMPYMKGATLTERLRDEGTFSLLQARELLAYLVDGLAYLHEKSLTHGNIKANNVLFNEAGEAYLADFGMPSLVTREEEQEEQEDLFVCTYLPPEVKAGKSIDVYTDIYQLGVLLFEMLTGHPPATNEAPLLSHYRTDVPIGCTDVITRAIQPEKKDRYASVTDLLTAFDAAIAQSIVSHASQKEPTLTSWPLFNRLSMANVMTWLSFFALLTIKNILPAQALKKEYHLPTPKPLRMGLFLSTLFAWLMFLMRAVMAVMP